MFTKQATIYNKVFDEETRSIKYQRCNVDAVHIESNQSFTFENGTMMPNNNSVFIMPLEGYNDTWKVNEGDIIVEGELAIDIDRQQDLKGYKSYTVKNVEVFDYSITEALRHVEVSC